MSKAARGVVCTGGDQHIRVAGVSYIIIWRVGLHVIIEFLDLWVTPLFELYDGEGNALIQHCIDHLNEYDVSEIAGY